MDRRTYPCSAVKTIFLCITKRLKGFDSKRTIDDAIKRILSARETLLVSVRRTLPSVFPRTEPANILTDNLTSKVDHFVSNIPTADPENALVQNDASLEIFQLSNVEILPFIQSMVSFGSPPYQVLHMPILKKLFVSIRVQSTVINESSKTAFSPTNSK